MIQHTVGTPYMVGDVHFYTFELDGEPALVDTGPPTPAGRAALAQAVDLQRLRHVFLTHCHIDHYGLIDWLEERSPATFYIARNDLAKLERHDEHLAKAIGLIGEFGLGKAFIALVRESFVRTTVFPRDRSRYRVIEDTPELAGLGAGWIACPGHSQSDIAWVFGDEAVTGDILLKGIFQVPLLDLDLSTFSGRFRNYDAYCASLAGLSGLRGKRILPGHRGTAEVDAAVVEYVGTFLKRSAHIRPHRGKDLDTIMHEVFKGRLREPFYYYLKVSEIVCMLDFLEDPEPLRRGMEGIGLFDRVAGAYEAAVPPKR